MSLLETLIGGSVGNNQHDLAQRVEALHAEVQGIAHVMGSIDKHLASGASDAVRDSLAEIKAKVSDEKLAIPLATISEKISGIDNKLTTTTDNLKWWGSVVAGAIVVLGGAEFTFLVSESRSLREEAAKERHLAREEAAKDRQLLAERFDKVMLQTLQKK